MNSLTEYFSFLIFVYILGTATLQEERKQQNQDKPIIYGKIIDSF